MLTAEIAACCKQLKLSRNIVEMADMVQAPSHQEYLLKLLRSELEHRESQRKDKFLKNAGFYSVKDIGGFRFDEVTLPAAVTPEYLGNCEFLKTKTNLVMYGNVGTGKTYLSIALGVEACKRGIQTRFFRTAALVNRLSEAKKNGSLSAFMNKLAKADLLICDEWGYVPLDRTGAQLLFEVVSECYERNTLIINTNIEFSRWVNVFYDEQMTGAILDRVLHHCHLLLFPGQSNRMRESGLRQ
ncbi:mobile element protein [Dehalogenimonas sp. WBC-2]|nr:mobile element protein [Dehalogenimonas sp. WBC-2]